MNKLDTCAIHSKEQCSCLAYLIVLGCRDLEMEEELEKEEKEQGKMDDLFELEQQLEPTEPIKQQGNNLVVMKTAKPKIKPPKLVYDIDFELIRDSINEARAKSAVGLGEILLENFHFAKDMGGNLYYYRDGAYRVDGDAMILCQVQRIMNKMGVIHKWTSRKAHEVINFIAPTAPLLYERPYNYCINLKNGIYVFKHERLIKHDPDYITTVQLPVNYDPEAKCPKWEKFVSELFPAMPHTDIVWRIIAWLMVPNTFNQKALMMIGGGSNGKSTLIDALMVFLGSENCSGLNLKKMQEKFSTPTLIGKLANMVPDLSEEKIKDTSIFKQLSVNEEITGEYKHGAIFKIRPFARHVFSSYKMPESDDDSEGFYRRFDTLKFEASFPVDPEKGKAITKGLAEPSELSGVLNKAIKFVGDVNKHGLKIPEILKVSIDEHKKENNPLIEWLDDNLEKQDGGYVSKGDTYIAYTKSQRYPVSANKFGRSLHQHFGTDKGKDLQKAVNGKTVWCYVGVSQKGPVSLDEYEDFTGDGL